MAVPERPKIYHITHVDNLPKILRDKGLVSDAEATQRDGIVRIGMSKIKLRRLHLPVQGHDGLKVGACVPFYFCSRSVMLYLIHQANHEDLAYRDGQGPIVHLEADLMTAVEWANGNEARWAYTLSNAGAYYTEFRSGLDDLGEVNWTAVNALKWGGIGVPQETREGKQAEFLVEDTFPWNLVDRIGVRSQSVYDKVRGYLKDADHRPKVEIRPDWYY